MLKPPSYVEDLSLNYFQHHSLKEITICSPFFTIYYPILKFLKSSKLLMALTRSNVDSENDIRDYGEEKRSKIGNIRIVNSIIIFYYLLMGCQ